MQQLVIQQQNAGECAAIELPRVQKSKESGGCLPLRGWDQVKVSGRGVRRANVGARSGERGGERPDLQWEITQIVRSICTQIRKENETTLERKETCVCVWWCG